MKVFRTFGMLRLAMLVGGLAIVLLGTPHRAMAQESNNLVDDQCFDIGYGTGCDVEGVAFIAANSSEVDSYVETLIDPTVADDGWYAYVEGDLYAGSNYLDSCVNESDLETDCSMVDSTVLNTFYALGGYHGVDDGLGDGFIAGQTTVWISAYAPLVSSLTPMYAYVGTVGEILVSGQYLLDPNTGDFTVYLTPASNGNTSGMGVGFNGVSLDGTQAQVGYTLDTCAGTGGRYINIATSFGYDNGDLVFNVGDPTPTILSVSPGVWKAGTASLPITITGIGFGSAPTLTVLGNGVSLVSTGSTTDTQITATVSISSSAPVSNGHSYGSIERLLRKRLPAGEQQLFHRNIRCAGPADSCSYAHDSVIRAEHHNHAVGSGGAANGSQCDSTARHDCPVAAVVVTGRSHCRWLHRINKRWRVCGFDPGTGVAERGVQQHCRYDELVIRFLLARFRGRKPADGHLHIHSQQWRKCVSYGNVRD